jgi:hypothetical protein
MQHPGREQRVDQLGAIARLEPAARGAQRLAEESREAAKAASPCFARNDLERCARPQRAAQQREEKGRVGADAVEVGGEARTVTRSELVESGNVRLAVHGQDGVPPVRQQHRRRRRRVREGEPALLQFGADLGVAR